MNERLVDSAYSFMQLLETLGLNGAWDDDIQTLLQMEETRKKCCCAEPRRQAEKAIEAIYKKIIFTRLEDIKNELLELSRDKGYSALRFKGAFHINRRQREEYDKLIFHEAPLGR